MLSLCVNAFRRYNENPFSGLKYVFAWVRIAKSKKLSKKRNQSEKNKFKYIFCYNVFGT